MSGRRRREQAGWRIDLPGEAATVALAAFVAEWIKPGDLIALSGDLGAAKTTFARALIRASPGDPALEAPSPTFTLMQTYDGPGYPIVHADFYRIRHPDELFNLGWEEAIEGALTLVEWPETAPAISRSRPARNRLSARCGRARIIAARS